MKKCICNVDENTGQAVKSLLCSILMYPHDVRHLAQNGGIAPIWLTISDAPVTLGGEQ